jgi:anti-sigma B factor antagonist
MDLVVEELGEVTKIVLRGRFDTTGAITVELPFNAVATEKRAVVVDLTDVNFVSSYALRVLLVGAKIVERKGGKLAILCPENNIAKVLRTAGIDALIPVRNREDAAVAAVR